MSGGAELWAAAIPVRLGRQVAQLSSRARGGWGNLIRIDPGSGPESGLMRSLRSDSIGRVVKLRTEPYSAANVLRTSRVSLAGRSPGRYRSLSNWAICSNRQYFFQACFLTP